MATCAAMIVGGGEDKPNYGVILDLDLDALADKGTNDV
jgi:hypothetical protein